MKRRLKTFLPLAVTALVAGGCVREARIALPITSSPAVDRLELKGMGAADRGGFSLGEVRGGFVRSAERDSAFGIVSRHGGGRFDMDGGEGALSGACGFDQVDVKLGRGITVTDQPLLYRCSFARGGRPIDAQLVLEESHDGPGSLTRYERKGFLDYEGERIALRSVHSFEGGKWPTLTPLGYAFSVDGREIGAIDLNGLDKTVYAPREARRREAVVAASLALSMLWDPADSD